MRPRTYLFVLPVQGYPLPAGAFAIESAFADHLRMLKAKLGPLAQRMVILGPRMAEADYVHMKDTLAVLDADKDGIRFRAAFPADAGNRDYARAIPSVLAAVVEEIRAADVVHSGPSHWRPFEFPALLLGRALGKKTISVTDIDNRKSAQMRYRTHLDGLRQYLTMRLVQEPWLDLQHRIIARLCSLVLLKGGELAHDYGAGRDNVKNFLDAAFGEAHVLSDAAVIDKARARARGPLRATYFGRLVPYKGVDHMLQALALARGQGADVELHVVGDGPELHRLEALRDRLDLDGSVVFHGAVPFGDALFSLLRGYHVLLAAPLSEDTPRSALDAMASGQVVVAYDTAYYRELARAGAPVELVPWNDVAALGRRIAAVAADDAALEEGMRAAVRFARENTEERWLDRRVAWTQALFAEKP